MKKLLFICLINLCITSQTKSQKNDTVSNMNAYKMEADALLLKYKKKKTTAWILLGSGLIMEVVGLAIVANDIKKETVNVVITSVTFGFANTEPHKNSKAGPMFLIAGTGAIIGSIPLFIGSGNNKRKANLYLKNETVLFNPQISKENFVAAGLKINL